MNDQLHELAEAGVIVSLVSDDPTAIDIDGPDAVLTDDLLKRIKANKAALLATVAHEYADVLLYLLAVRDPARAADLRHMHEERLAIVEAVRLPQHPHDLLGTVSLLHLESFPALRPSGFSHITWI